MTDDLESYLTALPAATRPVVERLRSLFLEVVPQAGEKISYGIPTFTLDGRAFGYLAGYAKHVSIHPVPAGDADLEAALAPYRHGPGTCRFPLSEPLPEDLIRRMITALSRTGTG